MVQELCISSLTAKKAVTHASVLTYAKIDLFIYLFIYTIFQEGDIFSSTASLPYGPLNI